MYSAAVFLRPAVVAGKSEQALAEHDIPNRTGCD